MEGANSRQRKDTDLVQALDRELREATTLAEIRALFRAHMGEMWPSNEFFFALFDRSQHRFLMLLEDGSLVAKSASNFALEDFLTSPGKGHTYAECLHTDAELLGGFRERAGPEGLTIHSLAVPIERDGFLRGALGIFSMRVFEWDTETIASLRELGQLFLRACERSERFKPMVEPSVEGMPETKDEWHRLRELRRFCETIRQILLAQLPPTEVVTTACREFAPFFLGYEFTIAVHYPESRLFVVYPCAGEPVRLACDETVEGYFLYRRDEEILAIEDYELWTPPPPLNLTRETTHGDSRSGLFAAGRVQDSLVAVLGLRSPTLVTWEVREVELIREAAAGFGLAFYQAMLSDNLTYSCREAHRQLEEARNEARLWHHRAEQLEAAAEIARSVVPRDTIDDLLAELLEQLGKRWPGAHLSIQRYVPDRQGFETFPPPEEGKVEIRPAGRCIQNLFLNNVPVSHVLCDSPQEIAYYRELDTRLVAECEKRGFRSFCTAPIFIEDRLWGAVTLQKQEPIGSAAAELLSDVALALATPIAAIELVERTRAAKRRK